MAELLQHIPWPRLSVRAICERAGVARSTYYVHFQSKQDLVDAVLRAATSHGRGAIRTLPATKERLATVVWLVEYFSQNRRSLRTVQESAGGRRTLAAFRQIVVELLQEELGGADAPAVRERLRFAVGGLFADIEDWLDARHPASAEGLTRRLSALVIACHRPGSPSI